MFVLLIMIASVKAMEKNLGDPATDYIVFFKNRTEGPVGVLTTSTGASIPYSEATNTLNTRIINNRFFMESITHLTRGRIPERIVHQRGSGAFGFFEVTHDISHICKAKFLEKVGKKTPVVVRFSIVAGETGSSDLTRALRGFGVKFYTEEGNFDIPGMNTPMYFYKDPIHFTSFTHASARNPATNLEDFTALWDLISLLPESIHCFLLLFADLGIPASYRNMPGFGVHTYQVENGLGELHFIKFHILPDAGIKNLRSEEALKINTEDPEYFTRDLFRAVSIGDFPSWTISVQILTMADVQRLGDRAFDVTRVIPLKDYPLYKVGKLVLNRNAKNFHAEMEQLALCPGNLVNGIHGAPDKLFEGRRLAYSDAQLYRLGVNFNKISVNCPFQVKTFTYNRDGRPPVKDNEKDITNYFPNSFYGPIPRMDENNFRLIDIVETPADNFDQAAELYANFKPDEKVRLIENIVFSMQNVPKYIRERIVKIFTTIHPDLGNRLAQGLNETTCN